MVSRMVRPETADLLSSVRTSADASSVARDFIVDQLAFLLGANEMANDLVVTQWHEAGGKQCGKEMQRVALDTALGLRPVGIRDVVCTDLFDRGRIFSCDPSYLVNHPRKTLGAGVSTAILDEASGVFKVMSYKRLGAQPDHVWTMTRTPVRDWYRVTYRAIDVMSGLAPTTTSYVGLADNGEEVPYRIRRWNERVEEERGMTVMVCSLIEDAHRVDAVRLIVSEGDVSLCIPVKYGAHLDALALRDAPMTSRGRRKAVLHRVREHLRATLSEDAKVRAHTRGVTEVTFDGMRIAIEPNTAPGAPHA
jgi:hypothetical protein